MAGDDMEALGVKEFFTIYNKYLDVLQAEIDL
jgi:hypothetical protein